MSINTYCEGYFSYFLKYSYIYLIRTYIWFIKVLFYIWKYAVKMTMCYFNLKNETKIIWSDFWHIINIVITNTQKLKCFFVIKYVLWYMNNSHFTNIVKYVFIFYINFGVNLFRLVGFHVLSGPSANYIIYAYILMF